MLDPARIDDVLRRGGDVRTAVDGWREVDTRRKKLQGELDALRHQQRTDDRMKTLDKKSAEFAVARDELKALSAKIKDGEAELAKLEGDSEQKLLLIPNA